MEHVGIRELYATGRSMEIDTVGMTPEEVRRAIEAKDESSCEDNSENE